MPREKLDWRGWLYVVGRMALVWLGVLAFCLLLSWVLPA